MGEIISTKATGLGAKRTQVRFQITSALRRHEATWLLVVSAGEHSDASWFGARATS